MRSASRSTELYVTVFTLLNTKRIYSDDEDVMKFATRLGIEVIRTWQLSLPAAKQIDIEYGQT